MTVTYRDLRYVLGRMHDRTLSLAEIAAMEKASGSQATFDQWVESIAAQRPNRHTLTISADGFGECTCGWWDRGDSAPATAADQWALHYNNAPRHYVTHWLKTSDEP